MLTTGEEVAQPQHMSETLRTVMGNKRQGSIFIYYVGGGPPRPASLSGEVICSPSSCADPLLLSAERRSSDHVAEARDYLEPDDVQLPKDSAAAFAKLWSFFFLTLGALNLMSYGSLPSVLWTTGLSHSSFECPMTPHDKQ